MTTSIKRISTRPDTSIPFYARSPETIAYMKATYSDTGQRLSFTTAVSADGLSETAEAIWVDFAHLQMTIGDPIVQTALAEMLEYDSANGITMIQYLDGVLARRQDLIKALI